MRVISGVEAKKRDDRAQLIFHIPSEILMENAGLRAAQEMTRSYPKMQHVLIITGKGHNAGDGFVVARQLRAQGYPVRVASIYDPKLFEGPSQIQWKILAALKIPFQILRVGDVQRKLPKLLQTSSIIVDAIFGIGLKGDVDGFPAKVIQTVNTARQKRGCPFRVVSLDIPSGLDATTGTVRGIAIRADLTVTFDLPKAGLFKGSGENCAGRVVVVPLGYEPKPGRSERFRASAIPAEARNIHWITKDLVAPLLPDHPIDAYKGSRGRVLVVAGSSGMSGAAILTSRAALASGAGVVYLAVPEEIKDHVDAANPEVITVGMSSAQVLIPWIEKVNSIAVGPGMGTSEKTVAFLRDFYALLPKMTKHIRGVVVDADGLVPFMSVVGRKRRSKLAWLLTPHAGEFSQLLRVPLHKISGNRIHLAQQFALRYRVYTVLKGHQTVFAIPGRSLYVNSTGNPGMATAGSGDVLTGVISGLIAQGLSPQEAGIVGIYVHGRAGDILKSKKGRLGFTAGDMIQAIPEALEETYRV